MGRTKRAGASERRTSERWWTMRRSGWSDRRREWGWVVGVGVGVGEGAEVALTGGRGLTWLGGEVLVEGSRCRGRGRGLEARVGLEREEGRWG